MERGKGFIWGKRVWRISFWGIILFWLFSLPSFKEEVKATREAEETLEVKGDLITLNFHDADIREALRLLSTHAGINIVPDAEVTGEVTIVLRKVSWERALDTILRMQRLTSIRDEDIIRVTTPEKLREEKKREELRTRVFPLNFAQAAEVKESIAGALSEKGKIIINERKNALLITDTAARLANIEEIMRELDTPTVQIAIEAKLIEVILEEGEDLGIDWHIEGGLTRGAIRPTTFPFEAGRGLGDLSPAPGEGFAPGEHFPLLEAADFTFGILSAEAFRAVLYLLDTRAETHILSAPTITTLSNEEARLHSGVRHPVPIMIFDEERGVWEVTGYEFIEIGVILTVTPTVRPGGEILMELKPEVSEILEMIALGVGGGMEAPLVTTKEARTRVMVGDGETLVIGGLMRTEERESVSRVPLLGDLPFLGGLFRKKGREEVKTDLLIFVTASIVQEPALLSAHQRLRLEEMGTARQLYEEEQRVEKYYLSGKRYFRRGDYEGAIIEFEGVLDFDPEHRGARRLLRRAERLLRERGE